MKKYFVVADIHSYYDQMLKALQRAGFNIADPEHILIVCGDIFDRGSQSKEIYNFLRFTMPKQRLVLIKGNHEDLFLELLDKDFPEDYDFDNLTTKTFCELTGYDPDVLDKKKVEHKLGMNMYKQVHDSFKDMVKKLKKSDIVQWLKSSEWLNYYEFKNYVFVHSFIPTLVNKEYIYLKKMNLITGLDSRYAVYNPNWRNATEAEWKEARWVNPIDMYKAGCFDLSKENNKILVCGHFNVDLFHFAFEKDTVDRNFDIYFGSNLIGLDGCTALTRRVNVLVLDENGNILNKKDTE